MTRCEHYQAQLLEHLYGLLSADESLALIEHAGQCDDCRAALGKADLQKKLLGAAAKSQFAGVRFQAPSPEVAGAKTGPAGSESARPFAWRRWAVAAAVLLALTAIGVPSGRYVGGFVSTQRGFKVAAANLDRLTLEERQLMKDRDQQLADASKRLKEAREKAADLEKRQGDEIKATRDAIMKKDLLMTVVGPSTIRVGEPTHYAIETRTLAGQQAPVKLDAIVRDTTTNQVVFERKGIDSNGRYQLALAPDVSIRGGTGLALELVAITKEGNVKGELKERLALAQASYVTHLYTDKPMYQPGETVHWRSLTLDCFTLKPATDNLQLHYVLTGPQGNQIYASVHSPRLLGQDGKEVLGPDKKPVRGIGVGEFQIPEHFSGGEYILEVREAGKRFPPERRKFVVNQYQKPRLNKELKWDKESYGPGGEVTANVKVEKAEGGVPLAFCPVFAVVHIDGASYDVNGNKVDSDEAGKIRLKTDESGKASIKFKLPAEIQKGDATLSVEFTDGANNEALNRPIPVVVARMQLEFFPEGGDLVAGVPNRVYFQARTMLDKPASVKGVLVDDAGNTVLANIQTLNDPKEPGINQGTGKFTFTPVEGKKYQLKVTEPAGIKEPVALPAAVSEGVVIAVPNGVTTDEKPIDVLLNTVKKDRELLVGVYCRGRLLGYHEVTAKTGQQARVSIKPAKDVGGVYRVTVFEKLANAQVKPVAERLVYRVPTDKLNVAARPDKRVYAPGEQVKLSLTANNEAGKPAPAIALVAVVDKSVIKMADERTARMMPTHFLLTSEVRHAEDLEYTDVLLTDHPKAADALDQLLGTQGWRRFLESDPGRLNAAPNKPLTPDQQRYRADVDRLLYAMGKMTLTDPQKTVTTFELAQKQIIDKYAPQFEDMQAQLVVANEAQQAAQDGRAFDEKKRALRGQTEDARVQYSTALKNLRSYEDSNATIRSRVLVVFGLILLVAGAGSLVIALTRNLPRALPFYGTAVAGVAVCGLLVIGTFFFDAQVPDQAPVAINMQRGEKAAIPGGAFEAPDANREFDAMPVNEAKPADGAADRPNAKGGEAKGYAGPGRGDKQPGQGAALGGLPKPQDAQRREMDRDKKDEKAGGGLRVPVMAPRPTGAVPAAPPGNAAPAKDAAAAMPAEQKKADINRARGANGQPMPGPKAEAAAVPGVFGRLERGALADKEARQLAKEPQAHGLQLQQEALKRLDQRLQEEEVREKGKAAAEGKNLGDGKGMDRFALRKALQQQQDQLAVLMPACVVREYAHVRQPTPELDERSDFTETLFWHPVVVLADGKAEVQFNLCDSVTSFQVIVFGHTADGRLGSFRTDFESKKPFNLSASLPLEITSNDTIDMPLVIENASDMSRSINLSVELQGMMHLSGTITSNSPNALASRAETLPLKPHERTRMMFRMKPTIKEGNVIVKVRGETEPFGSDAARYVIKVVPEGFPIVEQHSDVLEGGRAEVPVELPKDVVKGTLKAKLEVYPSTLADLQKGLEGLLREPYGCFEQTSTTNYPNVLILSYLSESGQVNPQVEQRARGLLEKGYGRLTSFECLNQGKQAREGYEWFGGTAPAHEALTAYGLLQFRDMQRVGHHVDEQMIERTRKYLVSRKDGKGGFLRNPRALDTFGRAPDYITNAYIVWAITEAELGTPAREDLDKEIDALIEKSKESKDAYFLALVANGLLNRGKNDVAQEILTKLGTLQKPEGYLEGSERSITGSTGRTLQIETTALAVLAWTKANQPQVFHKQLNPAIKWIGQQRGGQGAFGSTQSTILALKALLAFAKSKKSVVEPGELKLTVNGKIVGTQAFDGSFKDTLTIEVPDAESLLKGGANNVEIGISGKSVLPYCFSWTYQALTPKSAAGTPIRLQAKLDREGAQDGEVVHMQITVENTADKGQGMVTAIVGIPAGLNLPENLEQLKTYARLRNNGTEAGKIAFFEVKGRELVLYWRQMGPKEKIELPIDLICRVPGEYRGPASRAYVYYNADVKHWINPVVMAVKPKQ
jgi:hypothetical protein